MNTKSNCSVRILHDSDLDDYLNRIDVLSIMEQTFLALSQQKVVQPAQTLTLLPENRGDFITYQGALSNFSVFGAKLSPYIPTAKAPIITAWTMLMSMQTGAPLLLCDAGRLTRERTAATTALAVSKLAPLSSKKLAIIGSGSIALAHLYHTLPVRDWHEICIYSPNLVNNQDQQTQFKQLDPRVVCSDNAINCIAQADVVMLCTSAGKPVINIADIGKPALITSISTNVAQAHEIEPDELNNLDVYCDYKITTPLSAGEMVLAAQGTGWSADMIKGDLADLCSQACPQPDYHQSVFFRSIGLGIEDIAIAYAIYQQMQ